MKPYRITVDQAAIKADQPALHVHHLPTGSRYTMIGPLDLTNATLVQSAEPLCRLSRYLRRPTAEVTPVELHGPTEPQE